MAVRGTGRQVVLALLSGLLLSAAGADAARLVVGAVGARDELPVRVLSGEPALEVVLLDGGVVELGRDEADDAVGDAEALVELLGGEAHLHLLGRGELEVVGRDAELLDLIELVDAEDAADVLAGRSGLLAEAGGHAAVAAGEGLLVDPLVAVVAAEGLLGGGDEVLLAGALGIVGLAADLVELLVEVVELGNAGHDVLVHHVGGLEDVVSLLPEEGDGVVDEGLVEKDAGVLEEVGPMSTDLLATLRFVSVDSPEQVVVGEGLGFWQGVLDGALRAGEEGLVAAVLGLEGLGVERNDEVVLLLVLGDGNLRIDDVANAIEELVPQGLGLGNLLVDLVDLGLHRLHLGHLLVAVLLGLLLGGDDLLLELVEGRLLLVPDLGQLPPFLILGQRLVDPLLGLEAGGHVLAPLGGISALVVSQLVDVDGHVGVSLLVVVVSQELRTGRGNATQQPGKATRLVPCLFGTDGRRPPINEKERDEPDDGPTHIT